MSVKKASDFDLIADQVRDAERSRIKAILAIDMQSLEKLHSPDYQLITPSGRSLSREHYLGEIVSGSLRYLKWDPGPIAVKARKSLAVVRYRATLELDSGNGSGTPFECWHTDSYELQDGGWKAVWSQATAIR
jgi:Domain of unknown function (DUF4440)